MVIEEYETYLEHVGVPKRSGRYPYGSGKNPYQRSGDFLSRVEELSKDGISEKELAADFGLSTTNFRMQYRVAKHERRELKAAQAQSLRDDGCSLMEIAKTMGYTNDSSVRSLLNSSTASNKNKAKNTAEILKKELAAKGDMLDVGVGVERELQVSANTLKEAMFILETEGYNNYKMGIPSVNNFGKQINRSVLAAPDVPYADVYSRIGDVKSVGDYTSLDGGDTFLAREAPVSFSSKRLAIAYGDKGGAEKDGVMEIRRGVDNLSLGKSHYAQVRIMVDGTHYLKGMAMYSDDLPEGVDIRFNTNKKSGTPMTSVLKPIKTDDPTNPFGAYFTADGQTHYTDADGKTKLSPVIKLKEEGDWNKMSKNLSSQFLSKQPKALITKQLNYTYADMANRFDEIQNCNNPTIKKKLLLDFADQCDGAAVHLKSAALPRQSTQVLLPLNGISEKEIYAPNYKNGEKVALVRYPHGGTFEIPILTVNNKNKEGNRIFGKNVLDMVGINSKVAERLSGADFDGDQVVVIPHNPKVHIKSTKALEGLKGFDPKTEYPTKYVKDKKTGKEVPATKIMTKSNKGREMGTISNLITDMTLAGATEAEVTRAVRHSMVVIDAEKHKLDYKQSEVDNRIDSLKKKYQGYTNAEGKQVGGASTLLSRRKQTVQVDERKGSGHIDPVTGKRIYSTTGREYSPIKKNKKTGEVTVSTEKVKAKTSISLVEATDDLHTLSSGTAQERAYADYGNKMKAMGNTARKAYLGTSNLKYSAEARKKYEPEVSALENRLNTALMNAPKERRAQSLANSVINAKKQSNPELKDDKKALKKIGQQAIYDARVAVGASGRNSSIKFTDKEWEAVQAGAVSDTKLTQILKYADADDFQSRALPKSTTTLSTAAVGKIKTMQNCGYTNEQIATSLGKSVSTVSKYLNQ